MSIKCFAEPTYAKGRPTVWTEELEDRFFEALEDLGSDRAACQYVGINTMSLYNRINRGSWVAEQHPDYRMELDRDGNDLLAVEARLTGEIEKLSLLQAQNEAQGGISGDTGALTTPESTRQHKDTEKIGKTGSVTGVAEDITTTITKGRGKGEKKIISPTITGDSNLNYAQALEKSRNRLKEFQENKRRQALSDMIFFYRYARTKMSILLSYGNELVDLADTAPTDKWELRKRDLMIETRKWVLSKLLPSKYGDRVSVSGTVNTNNTQQYQLVIVEAGATEAINKAIGRHSPIGLLSGRAGQARDDNTIEAIVEVGSGDNN